MRRFRLRRRRVAAAALLPLTALFTTAALADPPPAGKSAQIDASHRSVALGEKVTLRGSFPGAARAPIEIRHRPAGAESWRMVSRATTGADGRYDLRVEPRRNGQWRADLSSAPAPETASSSTLDTGTGSERITVRSRTETTSRAAMGSPAGR